MVNMPNRNDSRFFNEEEEFDQWTPFVGDLVYIDEGDSISDREYIGVITEITEDGLVVRKKDGNLESWKWNGFVHINPLSEDIR